MQFKSIRNANLRNEPHFQFNSDVLDAAADCGIETMKIEQPYQSYRASFGREDEAFKKIAKSPLTKQVQEADKLRDEAWSGLDAAIKAASKLPGMAEKAYEARVVFQNHGNAAVKGLNSETAAVTNLVQDFEGAKHGPSIDALGLRPWVNLLKERNEAFKAVVKDRYDEAVDKHTMPMKDARADVDKEYRRLLKHIEVLADMHGAANYEGFATKHNLIVTKYKSAMRSGFSALHGDETEGEGEGT